MNLIENPKQLAQRLMEKIRIDRFSETASQSNRCDVSIHLTRI